ncbi:translation initiation factor IF-2-like [Triticum aestivum]|uniref:translation initiation factor IF-2-like n=1 Tax=Triticum aestivum TaxID=4565 RepID=UPI001D02BC0C|nr:translation initiation factor IF-2-like [Triticum aestivum]XP_044338573.1 translation initiation factor IF-2-like [Triticum aestivum]
MRNDQEDNLNWTAGEQFRAAALNFTSCGTDGQQQRRGVGRKKAVAARGVARSGARSSSRRADPRGPACRSRQRGAAAAGARKRPGKRPGITAGGSGDTRRGSWQEGNARSGSWLEGNARRWSWREGNAPAWVLSGGRAVPGRRTSWPAQVKNPTTAPVTTRGIAQVQVGGGGGIRGAGGGRRRRNQRRRWARGGGRRRNQLGGACPGDARGRRRKKMETGIYLKLRGLFCKNTSTLRAGQLFSDGGSMTQTQVTQHS